MGSDLLATLRAEEMRLCAELRATTTFRRLAAVGRVLELYRDEPSSPRSPSHEITASPETALPVAAAMDPPTGSADAPPTVSVAVESPSPQTEATVAAAEPPQAAEASAPSRAVSAVRAALFAALAQPDRAAARA
ncbi:hypothetical protein GCM10010964_18840 [Caldovatus sediminis]|uniref:Uncharacterized protein n=1 Tax=Caldovatus sediminis TaxID=2041189 RepID=A0A8J2ZB42_9PROT|nr:hypothetical protein [Caldovatus sediminis]GGG31130.1 hypothetical protein GCM10010964_18840 [Caldovatus sediminis]